MNAIFNESTLRRFNRWVLPLAVCWSLSTLGSEFLAHSTRESFENSFEPFFDIFQFGHKFALSEGSNTVTATSVMTATLVPDPHRIKAIYRSSSDSFVSISDATKTTIVPLGGVYKNVFHLISLSDSVATFRGYGKTCRLRLGHDDPLFRQEMVASTVGMQDNGVEDGEIHTITYQALQKQLLQVSNSEKDVDASAVTVEGKTLGFKINSLPPQSVYAQLGIQNGDIIRSVNNKKLESYAAVLNLYSQLQTMRYIRITLERNNLKKEIIYEITH